MRFLAGLLTDGMLADASLIPPCPPIPPTNIRIVRGRRKSTETKKKKEDMLGWLNASLKCTVTRHEPSTTLYLQSKINFKMPVGADATSLPTTLPQE